MSSSAVKINQKEYLKKYLSGDKKKKKRRDKNKVEKAKVRIIDDDDVGALNDEIDEELILGGEDAPQIVGEYVETSANGGIKWRNIAVKQEIDDDAVAVKQEPSEADLWGRKPEKIKIKDEFMPKAVGRREVTPDNSPPRRNYNDAERRTSPRKFDGKNNDGKQEQLRLKSGEKARNKSPRRSRWRSPTPKRENSQGTKLESHTPNKADLSPPRKRFQSASRSAGERSSKKTSPRGRHYADQSPPKTRRKSPSSDQSPPRRRRVAQSPERNLRYSDEYPPRRQKNSASEYHSAPRNNCRDADRSPPRKQRNMSDDQSPPRRGHAKNTSSPKHRCKDSNDQSPPRKRHQHQISPQRKRPLQQSPGRRRRDSDQSPPRRHKPTRPSPPTRARRGSDQSPPGRRRNNPAREHSLASRAFQHSNSGSPPPTHKPKTATTLDGKKAGLQDAKSLQVETDERRRQEEGMYKQLPTDISGRDAEVQVRRTGRRGRRAREAEAEDPEEMRRKAERELKILQQYERWGKGLKQLDDHQARMTQQDYEGSKPLARYADDADLETHLREQERAEDPMLEYMRKKRKERALEDNVPLKPIYEGPYPENRFGIRPGYRWDGVDRSNGYENKWFAKQTQSIANQEEAYKYSVEDM